MRVFIDGEKIDLNNDNVANEPDILILTDFFPFGMEMSERKFVSESYRWGFNGQERDDEIYGNGNSYTAEFWQYDSRLGRRWDPDPFESFLIDLSPYHVFYNNPISYIDINEDIPWKSIVGRYTSISPMGMRLHVLDCN